jgi:hypothetical protein
LSKTWTDNTCTDNKTSGGWQADSVQPDGIWKDTTYDKSWRDNIKKQLDALIKEHQRDDGGVDVEHERHTLDEALKGYKTLEQLLKEVIGV